jgi:hypothetical protein
VKRRLSLVIMLLMSLPVTAQDVLAPFIPPNATERQGTYLAGQVLAGRTDSWAGAPDFFCRQSTSHGEVIHPLADGTPKCYAKGMVLGDIGDAPDLVLRRAGPDNATYNASPESIGEGTSLGTLYWQAWGNRCEPGQYGFWPGCGGLGRTAQIYSRTAGAQTGTSRAGSLHFATTPPANNGNPVDRLVITPEGKVVLNTLAGMKEIEIGAPNSCGTGFRCLRIRN